MKEEAGLQMSLPRADDRDALAIMISKHSDRLLRAAFYLCRDAVQAQDLVQETFCRAIPALSRFRGDSLFYTWLYSVMRNLYFSQRRRRRQYLRFLDSASVEPPAPGPGHHAEAAEKRELLREALGRLSVRHREILLLRFIEEMKLGEIAAALGLPPGTVKSRLHSALKRLRRNMPADWLRGPGPEVDDAL
jgi:RNA polymerase sigma-70 factor (ECF subfamily)